MKTTVLSALVLIASACPTFAQQGESPITIEGGIPVPLAGAGPVQSALAGDVYLLPFAIRNRTGDTVSLRRVSLRLPDGLEVLDLNNDKIDNDRDGEVDEGDEGAANADGDVLTWRGNPNDPPLAPFEAAERAIKVRILPNAEAGSSPMMEVFAAASNGEDAARASRSVTFSLAPPDLDMRIGAGESGASFGTRDNPALVATLTLPSGRLDDLSMSMAASPSVASYINPQIELGAGITCDGIAEPIQAGRGVTVALGTCLSDPTTPKADRTIKLRADAKLKDADPFSDPEVIEAWRLIRVGAEAMTGQQSLFPERTAAARIVGPLIGARLIEAPSDPVDAGDALAVKYRLVNRGDEDANGLTLKVVRDGAVDCGSLVLDDDIDVEDACEQGVPIAGGLPSGTLKDISFTVRLRDDARFEGETGVQATVVADTLDATPLPTASYDVRLPPPPNLSVGAKSEWMLADEIVTARVGDVAEIDLSGALPEGRYPAVLKLLTRLVDAQTGEPEGPAPLLVESFQFEGPAVDRGGSAPVISVDDGWSVASLSLPAVKVEAGADDDEKRFSAVARVSLRDTPDVKAGRIVEITTQLDLFGTKTLSDEDWLEALIVEPDLDLTLRSTDDDRSMDLDTTAEVAALTCNHGMAAAHSVVLNVSIPRGVVIDDSFSTRFVRLSVERSDNTEGVFGAGNPTIGETALDEGTLRGILGADDVLAPDDCAALVFGVKRAGGYDFESEEASIVAAIEPYSGRSGPRSRIYPSLRGGEIRFTMPPVRFGPVSDLDIGIEPTIAHSITLELPPAEGSYRVNLSPESTAGLDWTVLRIDETGAATPWRDGSLVDAEETLRFRLEAPRPSSLPLGWIDTTLVRALVFGPSGNPFSVSTRLVSRRGEAPGGKVTVTKRLALDRDCDGDVGDERVQDALFEPVKDAAIGDCVIFRVMFRHSGDKSMEQIVVRDRVPPGTELRSDAVEILRTPDSLQSAEILPPRNGENAVVWRFEGLFEPGAEGEVSYAVRLVERDQDAPK